MEEQAWREVLERLARIETKLDNYETVRDKAERALLIAQSNAKLIEKRKPIISGLGLYAYSCRNCYWIYNY
ncbi:hypothetical protein N42HA_02444 [Lactococcus lactis]|nr:hypothetical protein [Lactococcus lactis]